MDTFKNLLLSEIKEFLFSEKLHHDARFENPFYTFDIPAVGRSCDLVIPEPSYFVQALMIIAFQTIIASVLATFVYQFIVKQHDLAEKTKSEIPTSVFLFGFGVAFPIILLEPLIFLDFFDIRNVSLRMLVVASAVQTSLRTLQAMYGFTPQYLMVSMKNYVIYFSCLWDISFDAVSEAPIRASPQYIRKQCEKLARDTILSAFLVSLLSQYDYAFFETNVESHTLEHSLLDMLSWRHMANNYLSALMLSLILSQCSLGVSLLYTFAYGYETDDVVLNPMTKASSPSDFWGRRWNNSVHKCLKNGAYKPARKYTKSKMAGVVAAFAYSGLAHEYINLGMFANEPEVTFQWKQMIFFGWNGMLIALESIVSRLAAFQWIGKKLPPQAITFLVIASALPVAHLFTGDFIKGDFFAHARLAQVMVHCSSA